MGEAAEPVLQNAITRRDLGKGVSAIAASNALIPPASDVVSTALGVGMLVGEKINRWRLIQNIQHCYGMGVREPQTPVSAYDLYRDLPKPLPGEHIRRISNVRTSVLRNLMNVGLADFAQHEHLSAQEAVSAIDEKDYQRWTPHIHPWDTRRLQVLQTALSMAPAQLYKTNTDKQLELYLMDRPVDHDADNLRSSLSHRGETVGEHFDNTIIYRGICECTVVPTSDGVGVYEPSVIFNRDKLRANNEHEAAEAIQIIVHELSHVRIESANRLYTFDGNEETSSPISEEALVCVGLENTPAASYGSIMYKILEESGDIVFPSGPYRADKRIEYSELAKIIYGKHEFVAYSTSHYLRGQDHFMKQFTRLFGNEKTRKLYMYLKETLFEGREYSPSELQNRARALVKIG